MHGFGLVTDLLELRQRRAHLLAIKASLLARCARISVGVLDCPPLLMMPSCRFCCLPEPSTTPVPQPQPTASPEPRQQQQQQMSGSQKEAGVGFDTQDDLTWAVPCTSFLGAIEDLGCGATIDSVTFP
jgi:hypothetical protein